MAMHQGLQQVFEENRESLLRYLRAHGAGDSAEDLLQELWLKAASYSGGPVASPRNYLFRAATNLMIDHRRSEFQGRRREDEWSSLADRLGNSVANDPGPDRGLDAQRRLSVVERELQKLPPRALAIFREHRLEGRTQRDIAARFGISASTVESDLRQAYRLLDDIRRRLDEE
jgi:RNA polymerase sigma-70 factor (ECF subfamily)